MRPSQLIFNVGKNHNFAQKQNKMKERMLNGKRPPTDITEETLKKLQKQHFVYTERNICYTKPLFILSATFNIIILVLKTYHGCSSKANTYDKTNLLCAGCYIIFSTPTMFKQYNCRHFQAHTIFSDLIFHLNYGVFYMCGEYVRRISFP